MRGARKMGGFTKIHVVSSEDAWADTLAKAKDKLLIVEFSAVSVAEHDFHALMHCGCRHSIQSSVLV